MSKRTVDSDLSLDACARRARALVAQPERPTLEEVREAVEHVWTDATHLPADIVGYMPLCHHLKDAAELLDRMIAHQQKVKQAREKRDFKGDRPHRSERASGRGGR